METAFLKDVILSSAKKDIREKALNILLKQFGIDYIIDGVGVSYETYGEVVDRLKEGKLIHAIKVFRENNHGMGLKTAKHHIDNFREELRKAGEIK